MLINSFPLVSIIIPVYNGADYLKFAIESAINQTYPKVEIIVVNDGSTDGGESERITLEYPQVRYFKKENGGVASALNFGIKKSIGTWIYWLSHDDMYDKCRVEKDLEIINYNPSAKVVFSDLIKIDSGGTVLGNCIYGASNITRISQLIENNCLHFCAIMFNKIVINEVGYFNEENRTMQDVEMVLKMACRYTFIKNNYMGTFVREFPELLFMKFNKRMLSDMKLVNDFIRTDFFLARYFQGSINIYHETVVLSGFFRFLGNAQFSYDLIKKAIQQTQFGGVKKSWLLFYFYLRKLKSPKVILIIFWTRAILNKIRF